jgi:hypothetical protein
MYPVTYKAVEIGMNCGSKAIKYPFSKTFVADAIMLCCRFTSPQFRSAPVWLQKYASLIMKYARSLRAAFVSMGLGAANLLAQLVRRDARSHLPSQPHQSFPSCRLEHLAAAIVMFYVSKALSSSPSTPQLLLSMIAMTSCLANGVVAMRYRHGGY